VAWIRNHRLSPATAIAIAALVVALGGAAFAAIPDSSGTIHACYQKSNGNLRAVEAAGECRGSERTLEWNQRGAPADGNIRAFDDVTLSNGESRELLSEGPLTLTARCRLRAPFGILERDEATILISTNQDHAAFDAAGASNPDLMTTSSEDDRFGLRTAATPGNPVYVGGDFSAAAPDGTRLSGVLNVGVNVLNRPGQCLFGGHVAVDRP